MRKKPEKEGFVDRLAGKMAGAEKPKKIRGLGGWMIFPIFNLFLYGLSCIFLLLEFPITSVIGLILSIFGLVLVFQKSKNFPKFFISYLWVVLGLTFIESLVDGDSTYIFGMLIFAGVWTRYMLKSKRVKNTFVK